jgi:hypothetical protein
LQGQASDINHAYIKLPPGSTSGDARISLEFLKSRAFPSGTPLYVQAQPQLGAIGIMGGPSAQMQETILENQLAGDSDIITFVVP